MSLQGPGMPTKRYTAADEALADLFAREWDRRSFMASRDRLPAVMRVIREAVLSGDEVFTLRGLTGHRKPPVTKRGGTEEWARDVIEAVALCRGVRVRQILEQGTHRVVARARDEVAWLLRNHQDTAFSSIGIAIGGRHYSTAMEACRRVEARIAARPELRAELLALVEPATARRAA